MRSLLRSVLIAFLLVNAHRALAIEPSSADTLRLAGCYKEAEKAYPLRDKIELQESITDLKLSNFTAQYLPQLSLTGKATYQSQVLELPFKIPGATTPEFYKDNYQVSLNLDQLIYDGGAIGSQRGIARTQKELEQQSVAVELYKLRDRVNDAFFNVLLLQEQEKSLMSLKEALTSKLDLLRSQVKNGIAVESAADAVDAELKKTEQSLVDARANRQAALAVLSELVGHQISAETPLGIPLARAVSATNGSKKRPEYKVFDLSKDQLENYRGLTTSEYLPKLSAYFQYTYGRPSLNVFDNTFQSYYVAGVRASWTLWNWSQTGRQREIYEIQKRQTEAEEQTFTKNLKVSVQHDLSDIEKLETMIKMDEEIIALRQKIVRQSSSQLDNGVVTATDYLTELNSKTQAELQLQTHKIQLIKAKVQYLTKIGEELK